MPSRLSRALVPEVQGQRVEVVVGTRTLARLIGAGLLFLLLAGFLNVMREVVIWTVAAVFIVLAMEPLVQTVERWGMKRRAAVVTCYMAVGAGVAAFLGAILAPLLLQAQSILDDAPGTIDDLERSSLVRDLDRRFGVLDGLRNATDHLSSRVPDAAQTLLGLTGTVFGIVVGAFTVFFLALFLSIELPQITRSLFGLMPPERAEQSEQLLGDVNRTVARYVASNLAVSAIAAAVHFVALYLLGVPFALVLGLLVAVFDLVPLVGATLGGILVCAVSLTQGVTACVIMIAVVVVYQQVENHLIQPVIMGRGVQISPFVVLFSVLVSSGKRKPTILCCPSCSSTSFSLAAVAGPPSPLYPETPVPAIVVMVPLARSMRRTSPSRNSVRFKDARIGLTMWLGSMPPPATSASIGVNSE